MRIAFLIYGIFCVEGVYREQTTNGLTTRMTRKTREGTSREVKGYGWPPF
jgi:hypothetical protein